MDLSIKIIVISSLSVFLLACAAQRAAEPVSTAPEDGSDYPGMSFPSGDASVEPQSTPDAVSDSSVRVQTQRPTTVKIQPPPPAVLALMSQAEHNVSNDQLGAAGVTLERALRIQPRSAELWSRLAKIRLQQGRLALAANLAKKSNALAVGMTELLQRNQFILDEVRRSQGRVFD